MSDKIIDFQEPLQIEIRDNGDIILLRSFAYKLNNSSFETADEVIVVPCKFVSRKFRFLKSGVGLKISILHEYLCSLYDKYNKNYNITRQEADKILLESMLNNGYSKISAYSFYLFCRIKTFFKYIWE